MTSFGATNSVFIMTDENNSFSISTLGYWLDLESVGKLNEILELSSQNVFEWQVRELRNGKPQTKINEI